MIGNLEKNQLPILENEPDSQRATTRVAPTTKKSNGVHLQLKGLQDAF